MAYIGNSPALDETVSSSQIVDLTVATADIAADAITGAKIADDAIDSEHYTDASIDEGHIADNAVTLAKMAGLARGKIIYGDASGDPAALALGTDNHVLTVNGSDINWEAATSPAITTSSNADSTDNTVVLYNGSGATSVDSSGNLTFDGSALVVGGTNPSITIGDAGEEDTKLVFDGNAQDYYIGLDDTDDDFKIGLGSAVGTTPHIVIDETGAVTKPLQPAFVAGISAAQTNVTGDSTSVQIAYNNEVVDRNGDYDAGTYTFIAPVDGFYMFSFSINIDHIEDMTYGTVWIHTSNLGVDLLFGNFYPIRRQSAENDVYISGAHCCYMDANDEAKAYCNVTHESSNKTIDLANGTFSGCLLS